MRHRSPMFPISMLSILCACSVGWAFPPSGPLDWFDAMDRQLIEARFIPEDSTRGRVIVTNLTHQPIELRLPATFAAVPVLAQFGNGQGQGQGQGPGQGQAGGGGGGGQPVGGGAQNGNAQAGGNGNGVGGIFRIPPQKTMRWKATTVCLQHGMPEPNARMEYRLIRLDHFASNKSVIEVCERLGRGKITQSVAQAAAWHLANGLSWDTLAKMNRIESTYLGEVRYFDASELDAARKLSDQVRTSKTLTSNPSPLR